MTIAERSEFRKQVVLALLSDVKWMPQFQGHEDAAAYIGVDPPTTTIEAIKLGQKVMATLVTETADAIVDAVG